MTYSPQLDGLRGFAVLCVMAFHASKSYLRGGFLGVDIFFVLSGFLISSLLVSEFDRHGFVNLKNFYMRRVLRLAPALIAMLTVFCLVSLIFLSRVQAHSNLIDAAISLFYLSNWSRAFSIHPPYFLGHTWTLSTEEQFYIVWPLLLVTMLRKTSTRKMVVLFTLGIALLSWALRAYFHIKGVSAFRLYNGLDTRADSLMVGCAFGVAYASHFFEREPMKEVLSRFLPIATVLAVLCILALLVVADWQAPHMYLYTFFLVEILTAILIINILTSKHGILAKVLEIRPLVWLGSISYSLYLWHFPIFKVMIDRQLSPLVIIAAGGSISLLVASLSYYALEKPILKLKKRYSWAEPSASRPADR